MLLGLIVTIERRFFNLELTEDDYDARKPARRLRPRHDVVEGPLAIRRPPATRTETWLATEN